MTILTCPIPGCDFSTQDVDVVGAAAILNVHSNVHVASRPPAPPFAPRGPKLERPRLRLNSTNEDWNAFARRWNTFRLGSGVTDEAASGQLLECTDGQLGDIVLRADPTFTTRPLVEALKTLKLIAVVPVALGVLRSELYAMRQDLEEPFRTFAARVQGKAETCEYQTVYNARCSNCDTAVYGKTYYTDEVIRDVLLNGVADSDIRREALSAEGMQAKAVTEVIAFIESREIARNANPTSSLSALSSHRRYNHDRINHTYPSNIRSKSPNTSDRAKTSSCPDCGDSFNLFTKKARGWNQNPHTRCKDCWMKKRFPNRPGAATNAISIEQADSIGQISIINKVARSSHVQQKSLRHHIFNKSEWRRRKITDHPRVPLEILFKGHPAVQVTAIADTGAQSDLWSLDGFLQAGFTMGDLSPVSLSLNAANKSPIRIDGAFVVGLKGRSSSNKVVSCRTTLYVSQDVKSLFLSYDSMLSLGIICPEFPKIGMFPPQDNNNSQKATNINVLTSNVDGICGGTKDDGDICECPRRTDVPDRPNALPFPCTPGNVPRMRAWLLERYKGSTFNKCPHQKLPVMHGPPVEIHLQDGVKPLACHKAASVPLHWQEKVHADLKRDEALGVIEPVPMGEPVDWCHRMVVTRKQDGSPRRTVDLSPLNKHCKRETHNSESPFHLARRVPRNTWRTVTDTWNGYHSVPLRESDRHFTTFITPFGRWRYKRAPQGFLSSGDGYNRRFNSILAEFKRKERCVDDTIHYDADLEEHWWRTIDLLSLLGRSGIVLNVDKFQFSQREVDFAGFRISKERIEPLPKFLDAISHFPTPTSTTNIRSWFGLVNQVANYAQLRSHLEPFRPFLSPYQPFEWTPELESAFQASKVSIIHEIHRGVEIFDPHRLTCLCTDWSKKGVGYFLVQKHCNCQEVKPGCCVDGWWITLAGSRFLSSAEQNYAPIEGEALAIAWSLEQTKFFTMGCHQLVVATYHKPLTKLLDPQPETVPPQTEDPSLGFLHRPHPGQD